MINLKKNGGTQSSEKNLHGNQYYIFSPDNSLKVNVMVELLYGLIS